MYEDEEEIVDKINSLEKMAQKTHEMGIIQELCFEDLYFWAVVDKSLKLIDSFLYAFKARNITVLAMLTRTQIDCVLRSYASTLVDDSNEFCKKVLNEDIRINRTKSRSGDKMTDAYLCKVLGEYIGLPVYDLYQRVSGYVHFSASSFYNAIHTEGKNGFVMKMSKYNQEEFSNEYRRLSIELANHFYYFGKLLIECIWKSWIQQKANFSKS